MNYDLKKTILITGGFGFIGLNLIDKLLTQTSYSIVSFVRKKTILNNLPFSFNSKRLKIMYGNIENKNDVIKALKTSTVTIHLAARMAKGKNQNEIESIMKTNLYGTLNLLEAARFNKQNKVIIVSTGGVYGENSRPIRENDNLCPLNPYTVSKLAAERLAHAYHVQYGIPTIIVRPFNVYGPFESSKRSIPRIIISLSHNKKVKLTYRGNRIRDWIYIEDVVDAIISILSCTNNNVVGKTFNISTGKPTSTLNVTRKIINIMGKKKSSISFVDSIISEVHYNVGDYHNIQSVTGWKPSHSIEEGISKTVEWYLQ